MPQVRIPRLFPARLVGVLALVGCLATAGRSQPVGTGVSNAAESTKLALSGFIDRLPDLLDFGLPSFAPPGTVRLFAHPRFGDFIHEDYFRLPVGASVKANENIELNTELGSYFTHGLRDSVGNGLYQLRLGAKAEFTFSPDAGWSAGVDFVTPLSRPPLAITDGVRHTVPYFTLTKTIAPDCGLVGFATLGFDFIDHTSLPVNFSRNQLHQNSTILTLGVAREWRRMHVILRVFDGTTVLLSNEHENVFGFRPSLGIPILRRSDGTPRATVTFEGRTVWGPDGFEKGINTSVRLDLRYRRNKGTP